MSDAVLRKELEQLRRQVAEQQVAITTLTTRYETARALADEYHALFQLAGVGIAAADPEGRMLRVNAKLCDLLGYSAEALRGMSFADFTHPEDREVNWEQLRALYAGQLPEMEATKRYLRKDGTAIWATLNATVVRHPDGTPRYSIAVIRDISAQVESERALREERERLRLVTEHIEDVFWMSTPGVGRMLYVSPGYERVWGRSCASLYRKPRSFLDAIHPDDRPRVIAGLKGHARGRWQFEYRILRPDGSLRWIRDRGYPIHGEGGELRLLTGVATDWTSEKEAVLRADRALALAQERSRELERANRDLQQFAAVASHDLKAPLRGVAQLSACLQEDLGPDLPEPVREHIARIQARIGHMDRLIDDLLTYARAGYAAEAAVAIDLSALLRRQWEALSPPPGFHLHLPPTLPCFETHPTPLTQVFSNLLGNAVRHHHGPTGNIWIECREAEESYRFAVADDGPGITPDERGRVFDIFYIGDRRSPDSTGLGLALVKKLVEDCGGHITLTTSEAGGCRFEFSWPKHCPPQMP